MKKSSDATATGSAQESRPEPEPVDQKKQLHDLVAQEPFFAGMKAAHLQHIGNCAMRTHFDTGKLIFQKGDPANRFYVILKGGVALEAVDKQGKIHRVQHLGPHDILGWSWLFPPYYWNFDAVAMQPTDAVFFYGTRLREECAKDQDFGYALMTRFTQILITRLQATRQQWIEGK
jgi:CRP-like cAMP-binding protein